MNRSIFFLLLSLPFLINPCANLVQGQTSVSDSLLIEFVSPPIDTSTVNDLNAAADVLIRNYSVDAHVLAKKAAQLADSLSFQKGKASAHEIMGRSNLNRGNYKKSAIRYYRSC